MSNNSILIKRHYEDSITPTRAHSTDSGLDLSAYKFEKIYTKNPSNYNLNTVSLNSLEILVEPSFPFSNFMLHPHDRVLINTGISATVGEGFEIQIRPRSGLALKQGLTVLNTPGTIDEGYRNIIGVIIVNLSSDPQKIDRGMRIAQMVVCPVALFPVQIVEDLNETERNKKGFGDSGV